MVNSNRRLAFINSQNCNFAYIYKSLNVHKNCNILLFFLILLFEYRRIDSFRFEESRFWTIFHPIITFYRLSISLDRSKNWNTREWKIVDRVIIWKALIDPPRRRRRRRRGGDGDDNKRQARHPLVGLTQLAGWWNANITLWKNDDFDR